MLIRLMLLTLALTVPALAQDVPLPSPRPTEPPAAEAAEEELPEEPVSLQDEPTPELEEPVAPIVRFTWALNGERRFTFGDVTLLATDPERGKI